MPGRTPGADLADDRQDDVFGLQSLAQPARHLDSQRVRPLSLPESLRRQDMLDLAGADAKGQCSEGAVGARVAVAANDRRARQRDAQLGTDHVHDPLVSALDIVERDAELAAVGPHRLDLLARQRIANIKLVHRSARCGRPWRMSGPGAARGDPPAGARQTPGDSSLREPGAGRCTRSVASSVEVTTWRFHTFSKSVSDISPRRFRRLQRRERLWAGHLPGTASILPIRHATSRWVRSHDHAIYSPRTFPDGQHQHHCSLSYNCGRVAFAQVSGNESAMRTPRLDITPILNRELLTPRESQGSGGIEGHWREFS